MIFGVERQLENVRESAWEVIETCEETVATSLKHHSTKEELATHAISRLAAHLDLVSSGVDALICRELNECALILMRSAFEATAKVSFITLQAPEHREEITHELLNTLSHIYNRRTKVRAAGAAEFANTFNDPFSEKVYSDIVANDDIKLSELTKVERREIEQRWAFTTVHAWVEKRFEELNIETGKAFTTLIFDYGLSSHLLHADGIGLDLELDNATRPREELEKKMLAEACKHYSSLITCWFTCAVAALHLSNKSDSLLLKPRDKFLKFFELSKPFHEVFAESQREFYRRNR